MTKTDVKKSENIKMKKFLIFCLFTFKLISMEKAQQHTVVSRKDTYHVDIDLPQAGWPSINESNRKDDLAKLIANRLKNKSDLNLPIKFATYQAYCPPLTEACKSDDTLEITKELLSHKVNIDVVWFSERFGEWRPIHEAVRKRAVETVRVLAAAGANLESKCKGGVRPLHQAARPIPGEFIITNWDNPDRIKQLEEKRKEILKILLEHGANPNLTDDLGRTPLFEFFGPGFSMTDDLVSADLLLEFGAKTSIKNKEGQTITDLAKENDKKSLVEVIKKKRKEIKRNKKRNN